MALTRNHTIMNASLLSKLKAVRDGLLKLHLELIGSERAVYEKSAGPIPSPGAFLQLLAHDPWFEWLRPFSTLIAEIDGALTDRKHPLGDEAALAFLNRAHALVAPPVGDHGFGDTFRQALRRDPHVLAARAALVPLLGSDLTDP